MSSLVSDLLAQQNSNLSADISNSSIHNHDRKSSVTRTSSINSDHQHQQDLNYDSNRNDTNHSKKREIFRYKTDWLVSSVDWSNEVGDSFELAIGSYIEDYTNVIEIISLAKDDYGEEIKSKTSFKHPYPATKILWVPQPPDCTSRLPHLLATTADYLRLWRVNSNEQTDRTSRHNGGTASSTHDSSSSDPGSEVKLECLLNTNKGMRHCAPLTSFDWNSTDPSIIVTASVDTTCAIWDIEVGQVMDEVNLMNSPLVEKQVSCNLRSQILAHNHEVYDVSFSRTGTGRDVFVSSGGDGSVRLFDLRRLSTSTMLYEASRSTPQDSKAIVRVSCNKKDANYVSAFAISSKSLLILDLRNPGRPIATLTSHTEDLTSMSWAPHSAHHICSASNDQQALIWELSKLPNPVDEPLLAYKANGKINVINWSTSHSDWIAIGYENCLELLRV